MGLYFFKRINLFKGLGLNVTKTGIRPSLRTKLGSVSSRGLSLRTGIPGLTYRFSWKKLLRMFK